MSWEETFQSWGTAPGQTEQDKCDNAVRQIRKAIDSCEKLSSLKINIIVQGSYRNRTNVRQDSDVDIGIICTSYNFTDYSLSEGLTNADVGLSPSDYSFKDYKNEVGQALIDYFGAANIRRGNKAFGINENTYRVDADAVPSFEHRRYMRKKEGGYYYLSGTEFYSDNNERVVNWPEQNYENGVTKNTDTNRQFKAAVRILKRLRNKMADESIAAASPVPSYLIECLTWNAPNESFNHDKYYTIIKSVLARLFNATIKEDDSSEWGEINELKYLFRPSQKWTVAQTHQFLSAAWDYIGYKD